MTSTPTSQEADLQAAIDQLNSTLSAPIEQVDQTEFVSYAQKVVGLIDQTQSSQALQTLKVAVQGKKSPINALAKQMGKLTADDKKRIGGHLSQLRVTLQNAFDDRATHLADVAIKQKMANERIDITAPARGHKIGTLHPITQTTRRMQTFFAQAGFVMATGDEIESEYYNFEALNIPSHHPARAMHDTFYFDGSHLLRTHTSAVQIRTMERGELPIRIMSAGRVYRCDSDQTHSPMFHQLEGLYVAKQTNFAELKGLIHAFLQAFFGKAMTVRFRPSYFPFTEPSAEVDILADNGQWLEVMGCGMVHPNVLKNGNIDPAVYQGFAFGMGIERFAMLYYGVSDLRLFYQNDVRFLGQFAHTYSL